ncbi:unnamed protein product [Plutella xylostella]|uniref:(diamondback moth) hypothetical protein n=1 Tax=Plutella xylostella TaxID=51655 RepID=A0A8S4EI08_PLUXY|nr:unnamed protein product [Plutella xylostella]
MEPEKPIFSDRLQNILASLSQCKTDYLREKDECKRIREINARLEIELKEARELEKSHRYHLLSSREMIGNLQETVSELVYLRRDMKRIKDDLAVKDLTIASLEKEKIQAAEKNYENVTNIRNSYERKLEDLEVLHEKNMQQVRGESDTQVAQLMCVIEELRARVKEMEDEHRDKMNMVVLEYEEKLQRDAAQITQLRDQHAGLAQRTTANMHAYHRRLEELEEKLKQSQFKQYLAQTTQPSQYESHVERPYSVNRDYADCSLDLDPVQPTPKPNQTSTSTQNKAPKTNTLQVTYYGNKTPQAQKTDKKGPFNIVKKRKLYNEKDFVDF